MDKAGSPKPGSSKPENNVKEGELLAYVHNVSPIKQSKRSQVKYFNCKLQSQVKTYDSVSFKSDTRSILTTAATQKSPIKLAGYKRKANFRDNSLQDIEINRKTSVTLLDSVPFQYVSEPHHLAKLVPIKSVKDTGYEKQLVSILAYLNIDGCYKSTFNEVSTLKDVYCNDSSGTITLSLWNNFLEDVKESGVYLVGNVMVKCPSIEDCPTLATTKDTVITPSNKKVKHIAPLFTLNKRKCFPIKAFEYSAKKVRCGKCNLTCEITPGRDFQKCPSCSVYSKYSNLPVLRSARLTLCDDTQVLFYDSQLKEYAAKYTLDIEDEDSFTEKMLSDQQTEVIVNLKKICVCIL